jgi:hypothetical protein
MSTPRPEYELARPRSTGLVEVLDRVLDKGLFIGGDVKISLAEVELLTIRIRLIVCSLDKAQAMGLDWWAYDRHLAPGRAAARENEELREQVRRLEAQIRQFAAAPVRTRQRIRGGSTRPPKR